MKRFFISLIGLFLVASMSLAQGTIDRTPETSIPETMDEPVAYINYLEGNVFFQNFEKAELNMIIQEGYELNTQQGRVEILLKDGSCIRLDYNTRIVFAVLNENSIMLEIWSGNVYVHVRGRIEIGIKTLHKSFNLTKRGLHLIEVKENKTNDYFDPRPENDFDHWNNEREKELNRTIEKRYLPEELRYYESTLYNYGSWRYYEPYGYVWIPRVGLVGLGWKPYLYGRWAWYPIIGWTWVSYEPFGWCVYHYGRWHWHPTWGWYWIPSLGWSPAWVRWHHQGDYYRWSPIGYRPDSNFQTAIHKNQLMSRKIDKSIVSKSKLQRIPQNTVNRPTIQNEVSSAKIARKIYSPNSGASIQKRNTISPTGSRSPFRVDTQLKPLPRISGRQSFLSPHKSFSKPLLSHSRPIQKSIQKRKK